MKKICLLISLAIVSIACNENANQEKMATDTTAVSSSVVPDTSHLQLVNETPFDSVLADGSIPSSWENAGIDDPAAFSKFLHSLQEWVAKDLVDSISAHTRFPLKQAADKKAFTIHYAHIFPDNIKAVIRNQNMRQVFRNQNGAMLGKGEIWINQLQNNYFITAINN